MHRKSECVFAHDLAGQRGLMVNSRQNMNPRQSMQTYYGYAFESYCTSDAPSRLKLDATLSTPFGWSGDVNNNVQWCSVVRTKLGSTRILIGGEVDCVRGNLCLVVINRNWTLTYMGHFVQASTLGNRTHLWSSRLPLRYEDHLMKLDLKSECFASE